MFERHRNIVNSIEGLKEEEREFLYSALNIHGHICGGMPMGYVAGLAGLKALGIKRERNMDTMAIINVGNGHAAGCFADGVQFATGCTSGKGILKKEPKGKWSFLLIDKKKGKAVKVTLKGEILKKAFSAPFIQDYRIKGINPTDIPENIAEPGFKRPFSLQFDQLVKVEGPFDFHIEKKKPCFKIVECSMCGEMVAENYVKLEEEKVVCIDCCGYKF